MPPRTARERVRGEVRQEILDEAERLIREEGLAGLTMRKLASRLGYAPMSLYSYFADKQALLHELGRQGFEVIARRLAGAVERGGVDGVRELLVEFVRYAHEDPVHYRSLFLGEKPITDRPECPDAVNPAFALLSEHVAECVARGALSGDVLATSTVLWTAVHGVATVVVTFEHCPFGSWETYAETMVDTALAGVRARAGG
ncbi:TetR/AcrR family transcriptional regulator [Saccharopolyspora sp. NFXS83]|uniref:TetR/AcrR family transcriptional regulator n=1 Tax=Saccharopolyspora sp. NFXS83 TaxID=2993560 RepID=UPI00224ABE05|nr:TetR/AcrR family transcriptional regulator [Saccharopolyspora sp. NFXS83]MCX2728772.1 TetR/AcrR family transcriptional regulator [Saccharopolyspora sp. NFXS83]